MKKINITDDDIRSVVKEELDKDDEDTVKTIIGKLKKASQAHAGQAKQLTKDLQDNYEVFLEGSGHFYTENVSSRIERELVRDGIIDSGSDYKLEINENRMKVNGKKVDDETFEKYKKLYEKSTRSKMNKKSNMSINKKDN